MTALTEFLLERIAEDEAVALRRKGTGFFKYDRKPHTNKMGGSISYWLDDWQGQAFIDVTEHIARHDPARVLAECEAKRAIVELHANNEGDLERGSCSTCTDRDYLGIVDDEWPCATIRALALPYADHPDFESGWVL